MLDNVAIEEVGGPGFMYMPEIVFASVVCHLLHSFQATAYILWHEMRDRFLLHAFQLIAFASSCYSTLCGLSLRRSWYI